jgi:translation initiation factor 4E
MNLSGGKWIIRLKKGIADRFWEDLVMAILGDQFDECHSTVRTPGVSASTDEAGKVEDDDENEVEWPEICGCTISVRQHEDIVSVWNRVDGDLKVREQIRYVLSMLKAVFLMTSWFVGIRDTLRKVLNLSPTTVMEYKSNNGKYHLYEIELLIHHA